MSDCANSAKFIEELRMMILDFRSIIFARVKFLYGMSEARACAGHEFEALLARM
ncbi:MAG: hypothetical protein AAF487_01655 [Bacteroidota bacterium]